MVSPAVVRERVFVECSYTALNGGHDGIRRVTRNLANARWHTAAAPADLVPVVWAGFMFVELAQPLTPEGSRGLKALLGQTRRVAGWMRRLLLRVMLAFLRVFRIVPGRMLIRRLKPGVRFLAHALVGRMLPLWGLWSRFRQWLGWGRRQRRPGGEWVYALFGLLVLPLALLQGRVVRLRQGDVVVLVDSTWNARRLLETLHHAQLRHQIRFGVLVHDVFPLVAAHWCQEETVRQFRHWFEFIAPTADFFVANSEATQRALMTYLHNHLHLRPRWIHAGSFRLGADLESLSPAPGSGTVALPACPGFMILIVGTIEPRKNHQVVLDAVDRLLDAGEDISLVIVGRRGWKSEAVLERLAGHPRFGERLFHLDQASEADLQAAYARADCVVCASLDEGFGLPLAEALLHRKPVLASDIPVFREIAGDACGYFRPAEPDALAAALISMIQTPEADSPPPEALAWVEARVIDWETSAREFLTCVHALAASADTRSGPGATAPVRS